jgi:hypothetical protein
MDIGNLIQVSAEHIVPSLLGIYLFHYFFKGLLNNVKNKYLMSGIYSAVGALSGAWYFFHKHMADEVEGSISALYFLVLSPFIITMFIFWYILVISYIKLEKNKFKLPIMIIIVLSIISIGTVLRA